MAPDVKAKVEALKRLPLFTEQVALRILESHEKGRHRQPNHWCAPCMRAVSTTASYPAPKPAPLYPDREEIFCKRCRAFHWKPGRCFADDPGFLETVGAPVGTSGRMRSVKEALESPEPPPEAEAQRARVIRERTESLERDAKRWWT